MNFVCPYDKGQLKVYEGDIYSCTVCNKKFFKNNGIYFFYNVENNLWLNYGKSSKIYNRSEPLLPSHFWIDLVAESRPFKSTDVVFDLGAGDGAQTSALSNKVKELHWIDLSYYQLQKACRRQLNNAVCVFSDVTKLPYNDSVCDVCISVFLFEHVPYTQSILMLKEANRILKKGGVFLLVTENPFGEYIYKLTINKVTGISFGTPDPTHVNMLFPNHTRKLLLQSGFKIIKSYIPIIGQNRFPLLKKILLGFISRNLFNISYGYICEKI